MVVLDRLTRGKWCGIVAARGLSIAGTVSANAEDDAWSEGIRTYFKKHVIFSTC